MAREIKFRCFYDNKMHDNNEALRILTNRAAGHDWTPIAIVTQFVWLKLQGREIFEGDIVEILGDHEDPTLRYVIEWRQDYYGYVAVGGPGEILSIEEMEEAVYLGNIYENPDLLK